MAQNKMKIRPMSNLFHKNILRSKSSASWFFNQMFKRRFPFVCFDIRNESEKDPQNGNFTDSLLNISGPKRIQETEISRIQFLSNLRFRNGSETDPKWGNCTHCSFQAFTDP